MTSDLILGNIHFAFSRFWRGVVGRCCVGKVYARYCKRLRYSHTKVFERSAIKVQVSALRMNLKLKNKIVAYVC